MKSESCESKEVSFVKEPSVRKPLKPIVSGLHLHLLNISLPIELTSDEIEAVKKATIDWLTEKQTLVNSKETLGDFVYKKNIARQIYQELKADAK